jgi:hypothetical protein
MTTERISCLSGEGGGGPSPFIVSKVFEDPIEAPPTLCSADGQWHLFLSHFKGNECRTLLRRTDLLNELIPSEHYKYVTAFRAFDASDAFDASCFRSFPQSSK